MKNSLFTIVDLIENFCQKNKIEHRFVGSISYGGLLTKTTTWKIDIKKKRIHLYRTHELTPLREDRTIRDIDIILLSRDQTKILQLKQYLLQLKQEYQTKTPFPLISIEAAIYPKFGKRNPLLQLVTGLEVDKNNQIYLTFDVIKQPISRKSLEPWTLILPNNHAYTTRNPIADYYAYIFRSPAGIKPKDIIKVQLLQKLSSDIMQQGKKKNIDYLADNYYGNWKKFIAKLEKSDTFTIRTKKYLLRNYWRTIGTDVAHGKGIWSLFLSFSNQFTGVKQ